MRNPFIEGTKAHDQFVELVKLADAYENIVGAPALIGYVEPNFFDFTDMRIASLENAMSHMMTHLEDAHANYM